MKNYIYLLFFTIVLNSYGQDKLVTKTAQINFESLYLKSFQDVKAVNRNVTCVINTKTGEIAFLALIRGFEFETALMEEHFNENYMESNIFPKAIFRGKIENFDAKLITQNAKDYKIIGALTLHGIEKKITVIAKISKNLTNDLVILSQFMVATDDYKIAVPNIVKNKISSKIKVNIEVVFL